MVFGSRGIASIQRPGMEATSSMTEDKGFVFVTEEVMQAFKKMKALHMARRGCASDRARTARPR
jgi:hypothetical protein